MKRTHITGIDQAIQNIRKEVEQIQGVTLKGLFRAGLKIRGEAQRLCPVVTGNLKASAYTIASENSSMEQTEGDFSGENAGEMSSHHSSVLASRESAIRNNINPAVEVGFTAEYAVKVHENPNTGQATYPGASEVGQWKFLEEALKRNEDYVLDVIRREAKI